jgi:hypothetical protein
VSFDSFNGADFALAQKQAAGFEPDLDKLDAAAAGFEESWESGPTKALQRFYYEQTEDKNMTAQEANLKYNLADTPIAYAEGEMTSDVEAEIASERYWTRRSNEDIIATVEEQEGFAGTAAMWAGSLAAGFADPVNLAIGGAVSKGLQVGAGALKAGNMLGGKALATAELFSEVGASTAYTSAIGKQLAENLVESVAVDLMIVPLGEEVIREKTSTEQRVLNTIGGAVLGTALGSGIDSFSIWKSRKISHGTSKTLGTGSEDIVADVMKESGIAHANGKTPNPDHVISRKEMEFYNTRPGQVPYVFNDLGGPTAHEPTWHIGRRLDKDHLDQASYKGEGVIVAVDDPNLANNRVAPLDMSAEGEVFTVAPGKNRNILTKEQYAGAKSSIREGIKNVFDNLKDTKVRSTFLQDLQKVVNDSDSLDDLSDRLHDIIDDFKNVPNISEVINSAVHNAGFDGYHFTGSAMSKGMEGNKYNGLVLFKPEYFDPKFKGKRSMYVGKGKSAKNAFDSNNKTESVFYNPDVIQAYHGEGFTGKPAPRAVFDFRKEGTENFLAPFKKHEVSEIKRLDSHKSDRDYNEKAVEIFNEPVKDMDSQVVDIKRDVLEVEGYDNAKEALEDLGEDAEKHLELAESPDKARQGLKEAIFKCILGGGK